jgi:hypothetical protein
MGDDSLDDDDIVDLPASPTSPTANSDALCQFHTDTRILPFDPAILGTKSKAGVEAPNINDCTLFQFNERDQLYFILLAYVGSRLPHSERVSFTAHPHMSPTSGNINKTASELIGITLGTGFFAFVHKGEVLYAIHQEIANPVGTQFEAKIHMSLILLAPGRNQEEKLRELCAEAYSATLKETNGTFLVFRFLPQSEFWKRESEVSTRPIESVILDPKQKEGLLKDLDQFLAKGSRDFYARHGIPYKRSYLLHGVPGSGKTSLIQALAGHLGRSICYIQPSHTSITDDNLRAAFQRLPSKVSTSISSITIPSSLLPVSTSTSPCSKYY